MQQTSQPTHPRKGTTPQRVVIPLSMTFEQARQVQWQGGRGPNNDRYGTIGELLDTNRLGYNDLAWAVQSAYRPEVRAAALTLLAGWLGHPETQQHTNRFGPEVVGNSKYLENQEWNRALDALKYGAFGVLLLVGVLGWWLSALFDTLSKSPSWSVTLLAAVIVLAGASLLVSPVAWWLRRQWKQGIADMKNYRVGREGEEWVLEHLRARLDSRWTIFRNVSLAPNKGDLDVILVGPPGVWVLEIKSYKFEIRIADGRWSFLKGKKWKALGVDPVAQVRANAARLRYFIERTGLTLHVNAAVVLTHEQPISNVGPTAEPVWHPYHIEAKLSQLNGLPATIAPAERARIITRLRESMTNTATA